MIQHIAPQELKTKPGTFPNHELFGKSRMQNVRRRALDDPLGRGSKTTHGGRGKCASVEPMIYGWVVDIRVPQRVWPNRNDWPRCARGETRTRRIRSGP